MGLDQVEPFDEWEEFVLFASHYFLLVATNTSLESILSPFLEFSPGGVPYASIEQRINNPSMARRISVANPHRRRFGAVAQVSPTAIGHHGGLGTQSRLGTMDIHLTLDSYTANSRDVWRPELLPSSDMEPRMCHTITNLDHASLLVGGRRSPDHPLQDCWLYLEEQWKKVEDIPVPLFRHCATRVKIEKGYTQAGVLIYGGRTGSTHVSGSWFLWRESFGWMKVRASESDLKPRFSATMASIGVRTGILLGGMAANGAMLSEAWEWTLTLDETGPCISFEKAKWLRDDSLGILARMGACLLNSPFGLFFIGGVSTTVLGRIHDIVKIWKIESHVYNANFWDWASVDVSANCKRSLLVGHCAIASQESISILGGKDFSSPIFPILRRPGVPRHETGLVL